MLDQMRKGAQHPVVKVLFFMLAGMFVVWGVGDVFRNGVSSRYVANVGSSGITTAQIDNVVRQQAAQYQQNTGKTLTEDEIEKLGLRRYALEELVRDTVVSLRADDLHLTAGPKTLASRIYKNSIFFNDKGQFDKDRFKEILRTNNITEDRLFKDIKHETAIFTLQQSVALTAVVPDVMSRQVYNYTNETRVADIINIPADVIKDIPEPSETDLVQFYHDNQDKFSVPELRAVSYITFNIDKIKEGIKASDAELHDAYNNSISQYKTEETRDVSQYLFNSEADANAAYAKISAGDAKSYAKSKVDMGKITKSTAPAEVRDVIFALKKGEVSKPAQSQLGWHIFVVNGIEAEKTKTFDEVKGDIEKDLTEKKVSDEFSKFGNQIEDEFASGKTMEDIAKNFDLTIHKIAAVDNNGNNGEGTKVTDLADPKASLPVIFSTEPGVPSALTLLSDNATYAIFRIDSISQKRVKALDEVKGSAIKLWKDEDRTKLLQAKASEIATKLRTGDKDIIGKMKLKVKADQIIKRPSANQLSDISGGMANELFSLKTEGAYTGAYAAKDGSFVIAKLNRITKADPKNDKNGYVGMKGDMENQLREELMEQYINHLRNKYPVTVRTGMLDKTNNDVAQ